MKDLQEEVKECRERVDEIHGVCLAILAQQQRVGEFLQSTLLPPMRQALSSQHDLEERVKDLSLKVKPAVSLVTHLGKIRLNLWHLIVAVVAAIVGGYVTAKIH